MRRGATIALLLIVAGGCSPAASSERATAPGIPSATPATTSDTSSATPTAPVIPSISPQPAPADRYPVDLAGAPYVFRAGPDAPSIVGRIGTTVRLTLGSNERYLGFLDQRVVTEASAADGLEIHLREFPSGTESAGPIIVPGAAQAAALLAGSRVVVWTGVDTVGLDHGIDVVSIADGGVNQVIAPKRVADDASFEREVVVSESGSEIATTVCATGVDFVGNCQPTVIIDVATGKVARTLDLGGRKVTTFTEQWLLVGDVSGDLVVDTLGHQRWSTAPFGLGHTVWARRVTGDGHLVAEIGSLADDTHTLVIVDASTGRQRTLLRFAYVSDRNWWPELSTDGALALGYERDPATSYLSGFLDAATLDVATLDITEHAILVTLTP
jgi:hypothetical protein